MGHLLHRRTDERSQTFPLRLPDDPETATELPCCAHHRIPWKRRANPGERMVEREIVRDQLLAWRGELRRARRRRSSALQGTLERIALLLHVSGAIADRSDESCFAS